MRKNSQKDYPLGSDGQGYPGFRTDTREDIGPPIELAGEDPSRKKEDEVWWVDVGAGERAVQEKLCPPDSQLTYSEA